MLLLPILVREPLHFKHLGIYSTSLLEEIIISGNDKGKDRANTPVPEPLVIDLTLGEVKLKLPNKYSRDYSKLNTFLV